MTDEPTDEQIRHIYEDAHIRAPRSVSPYERRAIARRALFEAGRSAGRSDGITVPRDLTPESLAKQFHELYEALAPTFGYETRKASAVPWDQVPEQNRNLMTAVCAELLAGQPAGPSLADLTLSADERQALLREMEGDRYPVAIEVPRDLLERLTNSLDSDRAFDVRRKAEREARALLARWDEKETNG